MDLISLKPLLENYKVGIDTVTIINDKQQPCSTHLMGPSVSSTIGRETLIVSAVGLELTCLKSVSELKEGAKKMINIMYVYLCPVFILTIDN